MGGSVRWGHVPDTLSTPILKIARMGHLWNPGARGRGSEYPGYFLKDLDKKERETGIPSKFLKAAIAQRLLLHNGLYVLEPKQLRSAGQIGNMPRLWDTLAISYLGVQAKKLLDLTRN